MKVRALKVVMFLVTTFSVSLMLTGALLYKNVFGLMSAWSQENQIAVYLKVDTLATEKADLKNKILQHTSVERVEEVNRAQAAQSFQSTLKEFSTGLITNDEMIDLIPDTLEVYLKSSLSLEDQQKALTELGSFLKQQPTVDEISDSSGLLHKYRRIDGFFRGTGLLIFFVTLSVISLLIALMIRVYIDDSRAEIEVYSLLGATRWSIYKIFMSDVFWFLSSSLIVCYLLLIVVFGFIKNKLQHMELSVVFTDNLRFFGWPELIGLTALIFLFVLLNSFITVRQAITRLNQTLHE